MNRKEFLELTTTINLAYRNARPIEDMAMAEVWYQGLKDLDFEKAKEATLKIIMTSHFPPEISDIRKAVTDLSVTPDMTSTEAWGLVYKAIKNSGYHATEEYAKLPEICQRAIGSPDQLREMAMMEISTVNSVCMSHFIRNYDVEAKRRREMLQIPAFMWGMIAGTRTGEIADRTYDLPKIDVKEKPCQHEYTRAELDALREKYGVPARAS